MGQVQVITAAAVETHTLPGCEVAQQLAVLVVIVDDDYKAVACVEADDPEKSSEHSGVGQVRAARAGSTGGQSALRFCGQPDAAAVVACDGKRRFRVQGSNSCLRWQEESSGFKFLPKVAGEGFRV